MKYFEKGTFLYNKCVNGKNKQMYILASDFFRNKSDDYFVLVLWIHKVYFVVKKLEWNVIKAFWYKKKYFFLDFIKITCF